MNSTKKGLQRGLLTILAIVVLGLGFSLTLSEIVSMFHLETILEASRASKFYLEEGFGEYSTWKAYYLFCRLLVFILGILLLGTGVALLSARIKERRF